MKLVINTLKTKTMYIIIMHMSVPLEREINGSNTKEVYYFLGITQSYTDFISKHYPTFKEAIDDYGEVIYTNGTSTVIYWEPMREGVPFFVSLTPELFQLFRSIK